MFGSAFGWRCCAIMLVSAEFGGDSELQCWEVHLDGDAELQCS
jgi:hypothetical protein